MKDKGETSCSIDTSFREFLMPNKATKNYRSSKSSNPLMVHALQNLSRFWILPPQIFQIKMKEASDMIFCKNFRRLNWFFVCYIGKFTKKWKLLACALVNLLCNFVSLLFFNVASRFLWRNFVFITLSFFSSRWMKNSF